jgi:hypothetical protein
MALIEDAEQRLASLVKDSNRQADRQAIDDVLVHIHRSRWDYLR